MDTPKKAYREGRLEDARRLVLQKYAGKPIRRLFQFDGHRVTGEGDHAMAPDEDGHCLMAVEAYELRNISATPELPVRVEIHEGADKEEVLALLGKIADWVRRDFYRFALEASGPADPDEDFPF